MISIYLAEHDWNEVLDGDQRVAYSCANCGKSIPALIVIVKPEVAQRMRDKRLVPRGTELVESPWLPGDDAYAVDPRINEFGCPDWWAEGSDRG